MGGSSPARRCHSTTAQSPPACSPSSLSSVLEPLLLVTVRPEPGPVRTGLLRDMRLPFCLGLSPAKDGTSSGGCFCLGGWVDGLGEQRADGSFSATVVTLADMRVPNLTGAIDEVYGRPVPVSVCVPGDEVVVQSDRVLEPVLPDGALDVLNGPLDCELGRVDADDREVGLVAPMHPPQEWECALAVHAREGPELEQQDSIAKVRE